eukprot:UN29171
MLPFICGSLFEGDTEDTDKAEMFLTLQKLYTKYWTYATQEKIPEIWQAIKAIVWYHPDSNPANDKAVDLLRLLISSKFGAVENLSIDSAIYHKSILQTIIEEISVEFRVPDARLARQAAKTLKVLASASTSVFTVCFHTQWENMKKALFVRKLEEGARMAVVEILLDFITVEIGDWKSDTDHPLKPWGRDIYQSLCTIFGKSSNDSEIKCLVIKTLTNLLNIEGMFKDKEFITDHVCHLSKLLETFDKDGIQKECVESLVLLSLEHPDIVFEKCIKPTLKENSLLKVFSQKSNTKMIRITGGNDVFCYGLYIETTKGVYRCVQKNKQGEYVELWLEPSQKKWKIGVGEGNTIYAYLDTDSEELWNVSLSWQEKDLSTEKYETNPNIEITKIKRTDVDKSLLPTNIIKIGSTNINNLCHILESLTPTVLTMLALYIDNSNENSSFMKLVDVILEEIRNSLQEFLGKSNNKLDSWSNKFSEKLIEILLNCKDTKRLKNIIPTLTETIRVQENFDKADDLCELIWKSKQDRTIKCILLNSVVCGLRTSNKSFTISKSLINHVLYDVIQSQFKNSGRCIACLINHLNDQRFETIIDTKTTDTKKTEDYIKFRLWVAKSRIVRYALFESELSMIVDLLNHKDKNISKLTAINLKIITEDDPTCIPSPPYGNLKLF